MAKLLYSTNISSLKSTFQLRTLLALMVSLVFMSGISSPAYADDSATQLRPNAVLLDKVIAIVDDDIIMSSELTKRLGSITKRLNRQNTPMPPADVMRERVLDQLILESIQLQLANRSGIRIGDAQLNATIENIARSNKMTLAQFEAQLELEGDSYAHAREQIRREMVVSRVQKREVDRRVRITEQEIQAFLKSKEGRTQSGMEYLIGHILIATPASASKSQEQETKEKAEAILANLKAGEDFQKVAVAKSDGRQALEGGVIGWRKETELPTIAADIIPKLDIREPSSLIRTGSGFHIVTVLEKRGGQENLIEQSQVRHILISPSEIRSEEESKEITYKLHDRLVGGDDFAALAKANSDDPVSAIDGGNLEWVNPGQMVPAFEQIMQQTKVGELSEPFRSQYGWHILQVTDRRVKDMAELIQNNQAHQILHMRKFEEELANWLLEIKGESYIDIKED